MELKKKKSRQMRFFPSKETMTVSVEIWKGMQF